MRSWSCLMGAGEVVGPGRRGLVLLLVGLLMWLVVGVWSASAASAYASAPLGAYSQVLATTAEEGDVAALPVVGVALMPAVSVVETLYYEITTGGSPQVVPAGAQADIELDCQQYIVASNGYPEFASNGYFDSAGGAAWDAVATYATGVDASNLYWSDGTQLPCDPMAVFPGLYTGDQIAHEPWEQQFCTEAAVWDGGGYWAPASTSAALGTTWAWATASQLSFVNAACPLAWLETLPGFSTGQIASYSAPVFTSSYWTTGDSACDGTFNSLGASYLVLLISCAGPALSPLPTAEENSTALAGAVVMSGGNSSYTAYFDTGDGMPAYSTTGTASMTVDGVTITVPQSYTGDDGTISYVYMGEAFCMQSDWSGHCVADGAASSLGLSTSLAISAGGNAPFQLGTYDLDPEWGTATATTPIGTVIYPVAPDLGSGPTETVPTSLEPAATAPVVAIGPQVSTGTGTLSGIETDLANGFNFLFRPLTDIDAGVQALLSGVDSLGSLLERLFVPTVSPATEVEDQLAGVPAYTWVSTVGGTLTGMGAGVVTALGSCGPGGGTCEGDCAPVLGWSGVSALSSVGGESFHIGLPNWDPACGGTGVGGAYTSQDASAGGLFGYRSLLRILALLMLTIAFVVRISRALPWVPQPDDMAPPVQ
jgi:hypothetical protein